MHGKWSYFGEYAYKINDPANVLSQSQMNYANGTAFTQNITFSKRGFGISAEMHRTDNMIFKSDRDRDGKAYIINYIPTLSKPHTYSLLALYPCATQADGELGIQFDIFYKFKKGSQLGGKYGTKIAINYSQINALEGGPSFLNDSRTYTPTFINFDEVLHYQDFNISIAKKINRKLNTNFIFANQTYNKDVLEGKPIGDYGILNSSIVVSDISYKIKEGHTLRIELQSLLSKQIEDGKQQAEGDWSMGLIEYTISPNWFLSIQDMYNYGNENIDKQLHYININAGFIKGANRFEVGYGKKREGIFCVGGVCKTVPSSNGFSLSVSSSF